MKTAMAILTGAVMFLAAVVVAEWQGDVPAPGPIGIQTLGPSTSEPPATTAEGTTISHPSGATAVVGTIVPQPAPLQLPQTKGGQVVQQPVIAPTLPQPAPHTITEPKATKHPNVGKEVKEDGPGGTQSTHQNDRPKGFKLSKHDESKHGKSGHGKKNGRAEEGVPQTGKGHAGRRETCGHVRADRRGHAYGRGRSGVRPDKKAARC